MTLILDLFCGAGGCSEGYHRAGFDVVGVDNRPQPHYPFAFHKGDALEVLQWLIDGSAISFDRPDGGVEFAVLADFAAIHASPPCQAYSIASASMRARGKEYPDLVAPTRRLLTETGLPWVIENVPGAPVNADAALCGCFFGLRLRRVRLFEMSWHPAVLLPSHDHSGPIPLSVVGHGTPSWVRDRLGRCPTAEEYREAMGIDWMNRSELSQAIPPAYTEWIGRQLLAEIEATS